MTPSSNLVKLTATRKGGCEVLVYGFGTHIVYMPVPKPYPIWTRIFDVAERRSKKIKKKFLQKNEKNRFFQVTKLDRSQQAETIRGPNLSHQH